MPTKSTPKEETPQKSGTPRKPFKIDAKTQRTLLLVGGIAAVIILAVLFAPFLGKRDIIAAHMPANSTVYLQLDLNAFNSTGMQEIIAAFQQASGAEPVEGEAWQDAFLTDLEVSYEEDIQPWLGSQLGVAVMGDEAGGADAFGVNSPTTLLVIESKNNGAADAFVNKVVDNAEANGDTVTTVDHQGITIYVREPEFGTGGALARLGNLVFFADSADTLQTYLNLSAADSLANDANFKKVVGQLPGTRLGTFYMNFGSYMDFLSGMSGVSPMMFGGGTMQYLESMSMAGGARVVTEGIRIDVVSAYDESAVPESMRDLIGQPQQATTTIQYYPEETVLFFGINSPVTGFDPEIMQEMMGEEAYNDYIESIRLLSAETGLDLEGFLGAIGGDMSMGIFPQTTGIGQSLGMGLQLVLSSKDDVAFANFFSGLNDLIVSQSQTPTTLSTINGMSSYLVSDPFMGDILAFGSGSGYGFLTTDPSQFEDSADSAFVSLDESEQYVQTWRSFSSSSIPVFFLDMRGLIDALKASQLFAFGGPEATQGLDSVSPITVIAGANEPYRSGVSRGAFIIFIER